MMLDRKLLVPKTELLSEVAEDEVEVPVGLLRKRTRRDVLLFGATALAALTTGTTLLPEETLQRLGLHRKLNPPGKEWLLDRAIRIDDDVAEAFYSPHRLVPTYSKSQVTGLKNNYNGATPSPDYIPGWRLTLDGLQSGLVVSLDLRTLRHRFSLQEEITRFVCVEGWSEIAWWGGIRFADLLEAFPPASQAKWARIESSVNLDANGNADPYYISLDMETARHPQSLLATHYHGEPLTVEHGAPLRLLVPVKLGLKNVKAITGITFFADQPEDYWRVRGYSQYDGI
jgi:DMSO/TMAO reductase YedYZ molybdopterin-dependent catalytic subunit